MEQTLSNTLQKLSLDGHYLLVGAIDFGTTYSGYAFSFSDTPKDIKMNKNWGAEVGCESYKAPTCVMTNPDGSFHSFGYQAEYEYSLLVPDEDVIGGPYGYNLYRHFKMTLHGQEVPLKATSTSGHITPAIEIFTMALNYLKEHMMQFIKQALTSAPQTSDIRWVLTVPAIWTDESKGFMREAAFRAGLISKKDSRQLLIALEPEAASIFCQTLDLKCFGNSSRDNNTDGTFQSGDKILVIDAGGGTVDITAHEILPEGNMKEICPPSGGPWGGTQVDGKFSSLMAKILGCDFINHFKVAQPQQWLDFMTNFEKAKKTINSDSSSYIKLPVPYSFGKEFENHSGEDFLATMKKSSNASFSNGYIIVNHEKSIDLFLDPVSQIVEHVEQLVADGKLASLKYILLVGGFAECKVLQEACKDAFSELAHVLVPVDAQLAIIQGAVLFGHNPVQIKSRVARFTYGTESRCKFTEGVHDPAKKVIGKDGKERCQGNFSIFLTKGEEIKTGNSKRFKYGLAYENQEVMHFAIFKTDKREVKYIDDEGVKKVGEAILTSSKGHLGQTVETKVTFGHTELMIEARDSSEEDGFPMQITVDFLSE